MVDGFSECWNSLVVRKRAVSVVLFWSFSSLSFDDSRTRIITRIPGEKEERGGMKILIPF